MGSASVLRPPVSCSFPDEEEISSASAQLNLHQDEEQAEKDTAGDGRSSHISRSGGFMSLHGVNIPLDDPLIHKKDARGVRALAGPRAVAPTSVAMSMHHAWRDARGVREDHNFSTTSIPSA